MDGHETFWIFVTYCDDNDINAILIKVLIFFEIFLSFCPRFQVIIELKCNIVSVVVVVFILQISAFREQLIPFVSAGCLLYYYSDKSVF